MKIGVIVGSHRKDSESAKVGRFLCAQLATRADVSTWTLDLGKTPLPLWDEALWSDGSQWSGIPALKEELDECDGFIMIAPEWHGMVPAALKNFLLLWAATGELSQAGIGHRGFRGGGRLRDRRTQNEQLQKQPAVLDPRALDCTAGKVDL